MGIMMTVKLKVEILVRIIRIFMHKYSNSNSNNRKTSMIKIKIFNNKISRNSNISNSLSLKTSIIHALIQMNIKKQL